MSASYRGSHRWLSLSHSHAKAMASVWVSAQLGSSPSPFFMPVLHPQQAGTSSQFTLWLQFGGAAGVSQGAQSSLGAGHPSGGLWRGCAQGGWLSS